MLLSFQKEILLILDSNVEDYSAVQLFIEVGRRVNPDLVLSNNEKLT